MTGGSVGQQCCVGLQSQEELVDIMQDIQSCIKKAQEKKKKRKTQGEPTDTCTTFT